MTSPDADKVARSIDRLSDKVASLDRSQRTQVRRPGVPDISRTLTDEEADELRLLIDAGGSIGECCDSRSTLPDGSPDETLRGMWLELADMGLLVAFEMADGSVRVWSVTTRGHWAAKKLESERKRAAAEQKRRDRHDFRVELVGATSGLLGVVLGYVLARFL